jgi:hypothetical protein
MVASSDRVRFGLSLSVVERQQVADVGIRCTLRQFGEHVQQVCVRLHTASAASQHQAIDHRASLRTSNRVTKEPRFSFMDSFL